MNEKLSPIVLFVYDRPWHTKQTVKFLQQNELAKDSLLYIFSDGPKSDKSIDAVIKVREYIKSIKGFKDVIIKESEKNKGLANSIISGVTEVINKHGKVIVLEDDLVTSSNFLLYMNKLLNKYENENSIYSITGYNHPRRLMKVSNNYNYDIYFCPRASSWSWATWKNRWKNVDWQIKDFESFKNNKKLQKKFNLGGGDMSRMLINQMDGQIDSWAIRWGYHHFKNNAFCIYPTESYIDNIGLDGSGVHCGINKAYKNNFLNNKIKINTPKQIKVEKDIIKNFRQVYKKNYFKIVIIDFIKKIGLYNVYKSIRHKKYEYITNRNS
jgi:hypothetical protein